MTHPFVDFQADLRFNQPASKLIHLRSHERITREPHSKGDASAKGGGGSGGRKRGTKEKGRTRINTTYYVKRLAKEQTDSSI